METKVADSRRWQMSSSTSSIDTRFVISWLGTGCFFLSSRFTLSIVVMESLGRLAVIRCVSKISAYLIGPPFSLARLTCWQSNSYGGVALLFPLPVGIMILRFSPVTTDAQRKGTDLCDSNAFADEYEFSSNDVAERMSKNG